MRSLLLCVVIAGTFNVATSQLRFQAQLRSPSKEGNPSLTIAVPRSDMAVCSSASKMPMCVDASKPRHHRIKLIPDCLHCLAEATALRLSPSLGDKVCEPTCQKAKGKEEWFTRVQRCKDEIWCVDKFGHELKNSRKKGNKINCAPFIKVKHPKKSACEVARAEAKKRNKKYIPSCTKTGEYFHTQCHWWYCWCSMINGKPVPDTFHPKNVKNKPPCQKHYKPARNCRGGEGVRPHPFDCTRYLSCGAGKAYSCKCPDKQAFDPKLRVCNWLRNVPGCKVAFTGKKVDSKNSPKNPKNPKNSKNPKDPKDPKDTKDPKDQKNPKTKRYGY